MTQLLIPDSGYAYLACPYSHPSRRVQIERVHAATQAAARLAETLAVPVYSPITHGHALGAYLLAEKPHWWWMQQCYPLLRRAYALLVLQLPGWEASRGVALEVAEAHEHQLPISTSVDGEHWHPILPAVQGQLLAAAVEARKHECRPLS